MLPLGVVGLRWGGDKSQPGAGRGALHALLGPVVETLRALKAVVKSIVQWLWQRPIRVGYEHGVFTVTGADMRRLWEGGYYGKGSLSRSEPTWEKRGRGERPEENTDARRQRRETWKRQRDKVARMEQQAGSNKRLEREREKLKQAKARLEGRLGSDSEPSTVGDLDRAGGPSPSEVLHLTPLEVVYLLQTHCVQLQGHSAESLLRELGPSMLPHYVIYHHYRSLGWCVREGGKFACDFLLYPRGPPHSHAEFALIIMEPQQSQGHQQSLVDLSAILRVEGSVKKTLVLVYLDGDTDTLYTDFTRHSNINRLLASFSVREISLSSWRPAQDRA